MVIFLVGIILIYAAFKSMVDAGKTLPAEFIERQRKTKMLSPLMFGIYTLPYVGAYLLYQQFPRFAWKIIFMVLVIAAVEFVIWYYTAITKLKNENFPATYVSQMRRGYSLFGLGAAITVASRVMVLFE